MKLNINDFIDLLPADSQIESLIWLKENSDADIENLNFDLKNKEDISKIKLLERCSVVKKLSDDIYFQKGLRDKILLEKTLEFGNDAFEKQEFQVLALVYLLGGVHNNTIMKLFDRDISYTLKKLITMNLVEKMVGSMATGFSNTFSFIKADGVKVFENKTTSHMNRALGRELNAYINSNVLVYKYKSMTEDRLISIISNNIAKLYESTKSENYVENKHSELIRAEFIRYINQLSSEIAEGDYTNASKHFSTQEMTDAKVIRKAALEKKVYKSREFIEFARDSEIIKQIESEIDISLIKPDLDSFIKYVYYNTTIFKKNNLFKLEQIKEYREMKELSLLKYSGAAYTAAKNNEINSSNFDSDRLNQISNALFKIESRIEELEKPLFDKKSYHLDSIRDNKIQLLNIKFTENKALLEVGILGVLKDTNPNWILEKFRIATYFYQSLLKDYEVEINFKLFVFDREKIRVKKMVEQIINNRLSSFHQELVSLITEDRVQVLSSEDI